MRLPLRIRIEQPGFSVTLQDIEIATGDKVNEGRQLVASGEPNGGVYLLGYAAEMILKVAYIKVVQPRARPAINVGFANKEAAVNAKALIPYIDKDSYHSILFWSMLIEQIRVGRIGLGPLDWSFAREFALRTRRIDEMWKVEMRYLPAYYTLQEALEFEEHFLWLRGQQVILWS